MISSGLRFNDFAISLGCTIFPMMICIVLSNTRTSSGRVSSSNCNKRKYYRYFLSI
jgi:hypothetical protein